MKNNLLWKQCNSVISESDTAMQIAEKDVNLLMIL